MNETYKEEPRIQETISEEVIMKFAQTLLHLTGENDKAVFFIKHGVDYNNYVSSRIIFSRWKQAYVSLTYNKAINGHDFIHFDGTRRRAPQYEVIEYKRGVSELLPKMGYSWVNYEDKEFVISIDYGQTTCYIDLYHNKVDEGAAKKLLITLEHEINSLNYLKGEKLLLDTYNRITFFNFKPVNRDALILSPNIWDSIEKNLYIYLKDKEAIQRKDLEWKRGILIYGAPGTGKTLLGRHLCTILENITVLWVTPKCVSDSGDVEKLFEMARALAPTIVFIEDLDFFASDRNERGFHPILGELLTQLDGISSNDGVFVIGTTNDQYALDRAISSRPSRFDVRLEIGCPETKEREQLFNLFLNDCDVDYLKLAARSDKFSAAHIKEACTRGKITTIKNPNESLERAILTSIDEIREEELNKPPPSNNLS